MKSKSFNSPQSLTLNPKPQSLNSSCQPRLSYCAGRCCCLSVLSGMLLETRKWWMVAVAKMGVLGPKLELLRQHSCKGKSSAKKNLHFNTSMKAILLHFLSSLILKPEALIPKP